jgi:hypothetical protein
MRQRVLAVAIACTLMSIPAFAAAGKACEELKMEVGAKIDSNGVKNYELTIMKNEDVKPEDKVVGSCEGGTKKIIYKRK